MSETFLLRARWVVPVDPPGAVLEDHVVAVNGERIESVLPAAEASVRYPQSEGIALPDDTLADLRRIAGEMGLTINITI